MGETLEGGITPSHPKRGGSRLGGAQKGEKARIKKRETRGRQMGNYI